MGILQLLFLAAAVIPHSRESIPIDAIIGARDCYEKEILLILSGISTSVFTLAHRDRAVGMGLDPRLHKTELK